MRMGTVRRHQRGHGQPPAESSSRRYPVQRFQKESIPNPALFEILAWMISGNDDHPVPYLAPCPDISSTSLDITSSMDSLRCLRFYNDCYPDCPEAVHLDKGSCVLPKCRSKAFRCFVLKRSETLIGGAAGLAFCMLKPRSALQFGKYGLRRTTQGRIWELELPMKNR